MGRASLIKRWSKAVATGSGFSGGGGWAIRVFSLLVHHCEACWTFSGAFTLLSFEKEMRDWGGVGSLEWCRGTLTHHSPFLHFLFCSLHLLFKEHTSKMAVVVIKWRCVYSDLWWQQNTDGNWHLEWIQTHKWGPGLHSSTPGPLHGPEVFL